MEKRCIDLIVSQFGFYSNLSAEAVLAQFDRAKRFHAPPCTTSQELVSAL